MTRSERQVVLVPFSVIAFVASFGAAAAAVVANGDSITFPVVRAVYSCSLFALLASFGIAMKAALAGGADPSASRLASAQGILGAFIAQTATAIGYESAAFAGGGLSDRVELGVIGAGAAVLLAALMIQAKIAGASRAALASGLAAAFAAIAASWLGINGFGVMICIVFFIWIAQFSIGVGKIAAISSFRFTFAVFALTAWIALAVVVIAVFAGDLARLR